MKTRLSSLRFLFFLFVASSASAQMPPTTARLAGIVNLPDARTALIYVRRGTRGLGYVVPVLLKEGERRESVQVRKIDPESGRVQTTVDGVDELLAFEGDTNAPAQGKNEAPMAIRFDRAGLPEILQFYSRFTGRTVLKHPQLPKVSLSFQASAANDAEAATALEKVFSEKGIATVMDGDRFVMVVPESLASSVHPGSSAIKGPKPSASTAKNDLQFPVLDVNTFLNIYATSVGKTFKRTAPIGHPMLSFESQGKLTNEEMLYAFDTLLKWNGIQIVPVDEKTITAVRAAEQ